MLKRKADVRLPHGRAPRLRRTAALTPRQRHSAGIRAQQAARDLQQRRLARTRRPLQQDDFSGPQLKAHRIEHA
jgi:hypothetical protein